MNLVYWPIVLVTLSVLTLPFKAVGVQEKEVSSKNSQLDYSTVELVTGIAKPPFILEEKGKGMQLDLIREAFSLEQKKVNFIHMPLSRNVTGFLRLNADGIITLPPEYKHPSLFISKPYITYQNVAVSLSEKNFSILKIEDLSDKSVVAFQNAKKFLGESFDQTVAYSMDYREIASQLKQIEMLFLRQTEVIVLDINIFKYFLKTHSDSIYSKPVAVHYIFGERPYAIGFKSESLRDMFNSGITTMKESGSYQVIIDNYLQ